MPVERQASGLKVSLFCLMMLLRFIFKLYLHLNLSNKALFDCKEVSDTMAIQLYQTSMRPRRKLSASPQSRPLSSRKLPSKSPSQSLLPASSLRLLTSKALLHSSPRPNQKIYVRVSCEQLLRRLEIFRVRGEVCMEGWKREEQKGGNQKGKELVVVSKIEDFYEEYNCFCIQNYSEAGSVSWLILSNAVNRLQIEQEFNLTYDPIKFYFLKDIEDVVNFLNFQHLPYSYSTKPLSFFSKIINFGNYKNQLATILEFSLEIELHSPQQKSQLWLVSKSQLNRLSTKDYECCYLGENSARGGVEVMEVEGRSLVYVLNVDDVGVYLSNAGIRQLQEAVDMDFLKKSLFVKQQPAYYQKVARNYLSKQIVINLVNFPVSLAQKFQQQPGLFVRMSHLGSSPPPYSVYFEQRQDEFLGLTMNGECSIDEEVIRIRNHFGRIARLRNHYQQLLLQNIYFATFGLRDQQFRKQLHWLTKQQVHQIDSFQCLSKVQGLQIILIANLNDRLRKILPPNVMLVDFHDNFTAHQTIISKIASRANNSVVPTITSITNFSSQFRHLNSSPSFIYRHKSIADFSLFLVSLEKKSSHLLILEMQDYTQERENQLGEVELLKDVYFEVYLLYGNEFILRNKNTKYTFLKKDHLLSKINDIIQFTSKQPMEGNLQLENESSEYNWQSDIQHNHCILPSSAYSTPNLYYFQPMRSNIVICVPKSVPHHTLLDRALQKYSLVVYSHINQVIEMLKYLPDDHYGVAITLSQHIASFPINKAYEVVGISEITEKVVRNQVDRIIQKLQLGVKKNSILRKGRPIPTVLLYNHADQKQVKLVNKMKSLFHNSKLMTMAKKEYKTIKKSYSISQNIQLYQIGKAQIAYAKRLKTIFDVFKLFMSPHIAPLEFSTQKLQFSTKQLFLRAIIDKSKKEKMGRCQQLSLSRSLSPKGKSILQKQCFISQPGLVLLESANVSKHLKRQKFTTKDDLISLCLIHLQKGSQMLAVIGQQDFFELKDEVSVCKKEIVWIVLVKDYAKCIIREANIVFCRQQQFQQTLALVTEAYREFKKSCFELKQGNSGIYLNQEEKENQKHVRTIPLQLICTQTGPHFQSADQSKINVIFNEKIKSFKLSNLNNSLVFNKKANLVPVLNYFSSDQAQEDEYFVEIVCDYRNQRFLEQSLKIIGQQRYILITYDHVSELSAYSALSQSLFILEKDSKIKVTNMMLVSPQQTPQVFSKRLRVFLLALLNS